MADVTPDTFFGGSITFGTSTVDNIDIISGSRSGLSVDSIDVSHAGTTGDNKPYIPGDLNEGGSYSFDVIYDPDDDDMDALIGVSQTITVTYPLKSGDTTAASCAFTGWIESWDEDLPIDDKMTGTLVLKIASDVTKTAAS